MAIGTGALLLAACAGDPPAPLMAADAAVKPTRSIDAAVGREASPDVAPVQVAEPADGAVIAIDTSAVEGVTDTRTLGDATASSRDSSAHDSAGGGGEGLTMIGVGPVTAPAARVENGVTYVSTGQGRPNGPLPTSRGGPDNFAFFQRTVIGDVEMTARLLSFKGTCEVAKLGLMMRTSPQPYAVYTSYTFFKTAIGTRLQQNYRSVDGTGNPVPPRDTQLVPVPLPVWMKLRRQGQSFTTLRSSDGVKWVQAFKMSVPVPATFHVGLFIGTAGANCEAAFDSITIQPVRTP